jgi:hypothetical protein
MQLSRGARRLFLLIEDFVKRYGRPFFASQLWIARRIGVCVRMVKYYFAELKRGRFIAQKRRSQMSAEITILRPIIAPQIAPQIAPRYKEELRVFEKRKPVSFERLTERERRAIARATPIGGRREPIPLSWEEQREVEAILRGGRMAASA